MPFIIGANSAGGDFSVDNSCMFNRAGSAYMHITPGGAGSTTTFTFSAWLKRGSIASNQMFFEVGDGGTSDDFLFYFHSGDTVKIFDYSSTNIAILTNQVFRDPSAWYHLVLGVDTTQVTDTNRVKLYVNGTQVTSLATATYPVQDFVLDVNSTDTHWIGRRGDGVDYFDGYMAEVCLIDGTQYAASDFGEFNSDSPTIWQPIAVSGLTFGTNGFYLDFEDSSDLGKDVSGNGNDLTAVNITATDQATDTPGNNFNVLNAIHQTAANFTISEGATKITKTGSGLNLGGYLATLMPTTGKWYFEAKIDEAGDGDRGRVGLANYESVTGTSVIQGNYSGLEVSLKAAKLFVTINGTTTETTASGDYADGDIVNIAMDLDNNAIYVGRNGTWLTLTGTSGGDPTSGASKTGAIVTDTTYILNGTPMCTYFGTSVGGVSDTTTVSFNFGNPAFTISSGNADADGYGNFEYAVPSGYFALCTKNLGAYGG